MAKSVKERQINIFRAAAAADFVRLHRRISQYVCFASLVSLVAVSQILLFLKYCCFSNNNRAKSPNLFSRHCQVV